MEGRLRDPARHRWRNGGLPVRSAAGVSARRRRRGPPGPKEGSQRPARHDSPWRPASCGPVLRRYAVSGCLARRYPGAAADPIRRAERALEYVEKVLTDRTGTALSSVG